MHTCKHYCIFVTLLAVAMTMDATVQQMMEKKSNPLVVPCAGGVGENPVLEYLIWFKDGSEIAMGIRNGSQWEVTLSDKRQQNTVSMEDFSLSITQSRLSDSGMYICEGRGSTNGTMDEEPLFEEQTRVVINDVPSRPPGQPIVQALGSYSLNVSWNHSLDDNNSPIIEYIVLVRSEHYPTWDKATQITEAENNFTVVHGLSAHTGYDVHVIARNAVGESAPSDASDVVYTEEAVPSKYAYPTIDLARCRNYSTALYVAFTAPPKGEMNGELNGYLLILKRVDSQETYKKAEYDPDLTGYNFTKLQPYTLYRISVQAFNEKGDGPAREVQLRTDEGIPSPPRITQISNRTDTMLQLQWERPAHPNGRLLGYNVFCKPKNGNQTLMYVVEERHDDTMPSFTIYALMPYTDYLLQVNAYTNKGESLRSDTQPALTDVTGPSAPNITQVTSNTSRSMRVEWTRPETYYREIEHYLIRYKSDHEQLPVEVPVHSNMQKDVHEAVLSHLRTNTGYEVQVAGATRSLFKKDKLYIGPFSDSKRVELHGPDPATLERDQMTVGIVAGIAATCILSLLAILALMFFRRFMKQHYHFIPDPEAGNAIITVPETFDPEREAIPVEDFAKHVASLHADTDLGFSQDYEEINRNTRTDLTANSSTDPENKLKNRYINILSYDHSRVQLKIPPGKDKHSDYINGNFVDGYHKGNAYIATQGPLPTTFADFWRMVWEQNSSVICMITNLTERGRRKCDQYWPNEGESTYGQITVRILNTYTMAHYTIRVFTLKNVKVKKRGSNERIVYQYHYTDWPDHGVPDYTLPVLMYVRKSAAASSETSGPIIIHCSAGVGRTGTYIVIDSMMRQIRDRGTVSIYSFLSHIRNQRNYLVQTEDQYIFLHDALLEYIQSNGETEVKDASIAKYMDDLQVLDEDDVTLLEKQYKLVTSYQPKEFQLTAAQQKVNIEKNRSQDIVPVSPARVRLPTQPGEEGSDYINASYLQGYNKNNEYIITQHPLKSTVADFWRMVWDQNTMTVILLSQTDEDDCVEFWPKEEEAMDFDHFKVTFSEEKQKEEDQEEESPYLIRDYLLQSSGKQDDYMECTTRLIQVTNWPECCTPLSTVFDLITTVKAWHREAQETVGPIIVIDKYGSTHAGKFCGLFTLHDQLHHEGSVDVYMVAKLYHYKRPHIFPDMEDYHFLYKAVNSVCEDTTPAGDRDSGISNCNNYPASMPSHMTNTSLNHEDVRQETTM